MTLATVLVIQIAKVIAFNQVQNPMYVDELSSPHAAFISPDFDIFVDHTLKHFHVPGVSIAVISGNDTLAKVSIESPCLRSYPTLLEVVVFHPTV